MDSEEQALYMQAGKICAQARAYGVNLIVIGASNLSVSKAVDAKIRELGGEPAFPTQISVNHIAAHYCSDPDDASAFSAGDLCKLDLGVHVQGYIADTAITVDLGDNAALVAASRDACNAAVAMMKPGVELRTIGKLVEDTITEAGFKPLRNLSGHGLAPYVIHDSPSIPNYDNGDKTVLKEGMVVAVEPFATTGAGMVAEQDHANIYSVIMRKPVRSPFARAVQDAIGKYKGLPFTTHWLPMPQKQAEIGIRELLQVGALESYPPLVEIKKGLVSQHEHSVIITKDGCIAYTRDTL